MSGNTLLLTELFQAARVGNLGKIIQLKEAGVNLNSTDDMGFTALYFATVGGHQPVMMYLMKNGGSWIPLISIGKNRWQNPNGNILDQHMGFGGKGDEKSPSIPNFRMPKITKSKKRALAMEKNDKTYAFRTKLETGSAKSNYSVRVRHKQVPAAAAAVNGQYKSKSQPNPKLCWSENYASMKAVVQPYDDLYDYDEEEEESEYIWKEEYLTSDLCDVIYERLQEAMRQLELEGGEWNIVNLYDIPNNEEGSTSNTINEAKHTVGVVEAQSYQEEEEEEEEEVDEFCDSDWSLCDDDYPNRTKVKSVLPFSYASVLQRRLD